MRGHDRAFVAVAAGDHPRSEGQPVGQVGEEALDRGVFDRSV